MKIDNPKTIEWAKGMLIASEDNVVRSPAGDSYYRRRGERIESWHDYTWAWKCDEHICLFGVGWHESHKYGWTLESPPDEEPAPYTNESPSDGFEATPEAENKPLTIEEMLARLSDGGCIYLKEGDPCGERLHLSGSLLRNEKSAPFSLSTLANIEAFGDRRRKLTQQEAFARLGAGEPVYLNHGKLYPINGVIMFLGTEKEVPIVANSTLSSGEFFSEPA